MGIRRRVSDPAQATSTVTGPAGSAVHYRDSHDGLVVRTFSRYLYDGDSTYLATVYDPATDTFTDVAYCSTWCSDCGEHVQVDAPVSLIERWQREEDARQEAADAAYVADLARREREEAWHTIRRGTIVRVARGRKVEQGLSGQVFWTGESAYGPRAGVDFGARREFLATRNLEVLAQPGNPGPHACD